jgi:hypothetical protein
MPSRPSNRVSDGTPVSRPPLIFIHTEGYAMKIQSGLITKGISLALLLALPGAGALSQSKELTTEALAGQAEVVAVGKVSSLVPQWNEDHSRIFTRVTLSVDQYIKGGSAGQPLTLLVPGGEVDGVGELYSIPE